VEIAGADIGENDRHNDFLSGDRHMEGKRRFVCQPSRGGAAIGMHIDPTRHGHRDFAIRFPIRIRDKRGRFQIIFWNERSQWHGRLHGKNKRIAGAGGIRFGPAFANHGSGIHHGLGRGLIFAADVSAGFTGGHFHRHVEFGRIDVENFGVVDFNDPSRIDGNGFDRPCVSDAGSVVAVSEAGAGAGVVELLHADITMAAIIIATVIWIRFNCFIVFLRVD